MEGFAKANSISKRSSKESQSVVYNGQDDRSGSRSVRVIALWLFDQRVERGASLQPLTLAVSGFGHETEALHCLEFGPARLECGKGRKGCPMSQQIGGPSLSRQASVAGQAAGLDRLNLIF